jgi:hypothetical protein
VIGTDIAHEEQPRPKRAVLANDSYQCYSSGKPPILRSAEQPGKHNKVESLYYERKPLSGKQPSSVPYEDAIPRARYKPLDHSTHLNSLRRLRFRPGRNWRLIRRDNSRIYGLQQCCLDLEIEMPLNAARTRIVKALPQILISEKTA